MPRASVPRGARNGKREQVSVSTVCETASKPVALSGLSRGIAILKGQARYENAFPRKRTRRGQVLNRGTEKTFLKVVSVL